MAVTATLLDGQLDDNARSTYTTASNTPTSNRLQLLAVELQDATPATPPTPTVTGCGLTWDLVTTLIFAASNQRKIAIYRAQGASPSTGTLSIAVGSTVTRAFWHWVEFAGTVVGNNGADAVVQFASNTSSPTWTGANPETFSLSITLAAFGDAGNAAFSFWGTNGTLAGNSLAAAPVGPAGPVTLIGSVVNSTANHGSASIASPTPTPGKLYLLSIFTWDGALNVPNVASVVGLGLTWTHATDITSVDLKFRLSLWWAAGSATGSAVTVTYDTATADESHLHLTECSRVNLSDPFSQIVTALQIGGSSMTIPYSPTPSANEAQYGIFGIGNNTVNIGPRTNWTEKKETNGNVDHETQALVPQEVGSPDASASCTFTDTGHDTLGIALALRAETTTWTELSEQFGPAVATGLCESQFRNSPDTTPSVDITKTGTSSFNASFGGIALELAAGSGEGGSPPPPRIVEGSTQLSISLSLQADARGIWTGQAPLSEAIALQGAGVAFRGAVDLDAGGTQTHVDADDANITGVSE